MNTPLVTVAMPAYNVASYVGEAIESVLAQDFRHFEFLFVDDASTDDTATIARRHAGDDPRLRWLHNSSRLGSGASRNRMLELARGRYYLPCDADDILLPGALRTLSATLDAHPDVGVVYADILRLVTTETGLAEPPRVVGRDHARHWDLQTNVVNHGGSMMRIDPMRQVGGYAVGDVPDDWGLYLKLAETTEIRYLPGRLSYIWRVRPDSQTQNPDNRRGVERLIRETVERRRDV